MNKYIKLFRHNLASNRILFIGSTLSNIFVMLCTTVLTCFFMKKVVEKSVNKGFNDNQILLYYYDIINPQPAILGIGITIVVAISMVYICLITYKKISNTDNTMFILLQLPIRRYAHLINIFLESIIFVAIQYILGCVFIFIIYKYMYHLQEIVLSHVNITNKLNFELFTENLAYCSIFFKSINASIYRLFCTIPFICSIFILGTSLMYKYKIKGLFISIIVLMFLALRGVEALLIITDSLLEFSTQGVVVSLIGAAFCIIISIYIFNRKIDF